MLLSLNYALASENVTNNNNNNNNNNNKCVPCGQPLTLSVVQTDLFEFHRGKRFVTAKQRGEHSAVRDKCYIFVPY